MIERVREIIKYYGLNATSFADKIGVTRASMSHIFSGRNQPSLEFVSKVKKSFPDVSVDWMIFGMGNMFMANDGHLEQISTPPPSVTAKIENSAPLNLFSFSENNDETPLQSESLHEKTQEQTPLESKIQTEPCTPPQILDSRTDKSVVKIVFIYNDNTFEIFNNGKV